jgi:hypothetical protein
MANSATHSDEPGALLRAAAPLLVVLMIIGGLFLWIGIPVIWLWIASQLTKSTQPSIGPYMLIAFGIPISMFAMARVLKRIDSVHSRATGRQLTVRVALPWLKSMRGERHSVRPTTALDLIMLSTLALAMLAFAIWFFGFAGSSLPNP